MKLIFENWRKFLKESKYSFDPGQHGTWFELTNGLLKALRKTGTTDGMKIALSKDAFENAATFAGPGVNPFKEGRLQGKETWHPSDYMPEDFYIYIPSNSESALKPKSKWLNRFFTQASHLYPQRNESAVGWWSDIENLGNITNITASDGANTLNTKIADIYEQAVKNFLKQFDSSNIDQQHDYLYHVAPPQNNLKPGQILAPYFSGARELDLFGAKTNKLANFEEILEKAREQINPQAPSRLNAAYGFTKVEDAVAFNTTWQGEIWLIEALGDTFAADMRIPEMIQSLWRSFQMHVNELYEQDLPQDILNSEIDILESEVVDQANELAKKYWRGEPSGQKMPVEEIIIGEPGIKLVRQGTQQA
jgi:hypothetical protein